MKITSVNNELVKETAKLLKGKYRDETGLFLVEGEKGVEEALAAGLKLKNIFVKGKPSKLQKQVYTKVLKAFLNAYKSNKNTGFELDSIAHKVLDNKIEGFVFSHGLGHGIGINVHEAPPSLNQTEIAKEEFVDGMCYTIEPGLYNSTKFGVRLENSCYRKDNKNCSFVKMGFEHKLIDMKMLTEQEKLWLKEFKLL